MVNLLIENDEKAGIGAITGVDNGDNYELLYHFRSMDTIITIQTNLPKDNPEIASIIDLLPGGNFHEKEVTDLLGIVFTGNPLHRKIFPLLKAGQKIIIHCGKMSRSRVLIV